MKYIIYLFILLFFINYLFPKSIPPLLIPPLSPPSFFSQDLNIKEKKSSVPTSWGGNSLSQETKLFQGIPVTTYSLSGGAWIYHKKVKLSSYQIEVIGEDAVMGFLKGGVRVEDKENKILLTANKGTYNKLEETITLEGRPILYYYNAQNKQTKVTATSIKRYMQESKVVLEGGVIMQDPDYTILAEEAVYYEKEKNLVVDKFPLIFGDKLFSTGEKAIYNTDTKITTLENETFIARLSYETKSVNTENVNSTSEGKEKFPQKEVEEKQRIITFFTGERLESKFDLEDEKSYIGMFENAKIFHPKFEYSGNYIKALGKNYKDLEAKEEVVFLDKENQVRLSGKLFEHKHEEDYTHITEDPKIEFLSKDGDVNSTLHAFEIERFGEKKEIIARGNVTIESKDAIIKGQLATYYEEEKKIIIEGNPTLEREGSVVRCGKIILYPQDNRVVLSDGIDSRGNKP
jgi:lipopolysaccharide export system protein LptA